jgi:hypothetical protein
LILKLVSWISALDCTSDASLFLLTGRLSATPPLTPTNPSSVLLSVSFDGYFDLVSTMTFTEEVHAVKRIYNSDFFMIGGIGKVWIVQMIMKSGLCEIVCLRDLDIGIIGRIEIDENIAYLLEREGNRMATLMFRKSLERIHS